MEKSAFIMWLILTIFQTIIFSKLCLLNKMVEEDLNKTIDRRLNERN